MAFPGSAPPLGPPGILPNQPMAQPGMGQAGQMGGHNKIDPNQIPRPIPSSSVVLHETRQNNQANPPPVCYLQFWMDFYRI